MVVVVVVPVSSTVRNDNRDETTTSVPSAHPTAIPSGAPSRSVMPSMTPTTPAPTLEAFGIVANRLFDNPEQDRPRDPTSPQWKALVWLVDKDGFFDMNNDGQVTFSSSSSSTDRQLARRYALATLYYATNGEGQV